MGTSKRLLVYFGLLVFGLIPVSFSACTRGFLVADLSSTLSGLETNSPLDTYMQGKALYQVNCQSCHGAMESTDKRNRSAEQISAAIRTIGQMNALKSLSAEDLARIAFVLGNAQPPGMTHNPPFNPGPQAPPNTSLQCESNSDPGTVPVRRLTKEEYINTLIDLFRDRNLIGRQDRAYENFEPVGLIAPLLGSMPEDDRKHQFSRLDNHVSSSLLEGQFLIAQALARAVAYENRLKNYAGDCALLASPSAECVNNFIKNFGKRVFRRPLKADEVTELKVTYDTFASGIPRGGFEAVLESMLLSPQFLFHLETEGTPVAGRSDLLNLSDYELASRLSYALIQSMPTDELMALADAGRLTSDAAAFESQIEKLTAPNPNNSAFGVAKRTHPLMMSAFQRQIMGFYSEWLKVDTVPELLNTSVMTSFRRVYDNDQFVWDDSMAGAKLEAKDFVFRLTFLENKKYTDILTDDSAVLVHKSARNYYHMPESTPLDQVVRLPNRAGILTRVPFLTTGSETSSPILRGVFIRRQILCDNLPSPDPDALPDRSLSAVLQDPNMSTRERYAAKTEGQACMGCHSQINPLGFAMEDFDSLGRNRSQLFEPVFQVNGDQVTLVNKLAVNASVSSLELTPGDNLAVNGGIAFSHALAASEKVNTCFVRQVYRYTMGKMESAGDDCQMKSMFESMNQSGGSIMALLKAMPKHPNFKLKKVGP